MTKPRNKRPKSAQSDRPYTDKDVVNVRRIGQCADLYQMFMVDKNAPTATIQRAYKKLALSVHPDKNKAPGATAAFRTIKNAVTILSDQKLRAEYDLKMGIVSQLRNRGRTGENNFREFFMRQMRKDIPKQPDTNSTTLNDAEWRFYFSVLAATVAILIAIPIGLIIYASIDFSYSFHRTPNYPLIRVTKRLNIPYYVNSDFKHSRNPNVEITVERYHINILRRACITELKYKYRVMSTAIELGNEQLFLSASNLGTPSCDSFESLINWGIDVRPT